MLMYAWIHMMIIPLWFDLWKTKTPTPNWNTTKKPKPTIQNMNPMTALSCQTREASVYIRVYNQFSPYFQPFPEILKSRERSKYALCAWTECLCI